MHAINQSINQSINESMNQSTNQPINQCAMPSLHLVQLNLGWYMSHQLIYDITATLPANGQASNTTEAPAWGSSTTRIQSCCGDAQNKCQQMLHAMQANTVRG